MRAICVMVRAENKTKEKVGIRHIWMLLVAQQINGDKGDQWLATGTDDEYLQGTCHYGQSS